MILQNNFKAGGPGHPPTVVHPAVMLSGPRHSNGQPLRLEVVIRGVGGEESVAPTALRILLLGLPALTHWANFCRASGPTRPENWLKPRVIEN